MWVLSPSRSGPETGILHFQPARRRCPGCRLGDHTLSRAARPWSEHGACVFRDPPTLCRGTTRTQRGKNLPKTTERQPLGWPVSCDAGHSQGHQGLTGKGEGTWPLGGWGEAELTFCPDPGHGGGLVGRPSGKMGSSDGPDQGWRKRTRSQSHLSGLWQSGLGLGPSQGV